MVKAEGLDLEFVRDASRPSEVPTNSEREGDVNGSNGVTQSDVGTQLDEASPSSDSSNAETKAGMDISENNLAIGGWTSDDF